MCSVVVIGVVAAGRWHVTALTEEGKSASVETDADRGRIVDALGRFSCCREVARYSPH
jgi:hypothetical protein